MWLHLLILASSLLLQPALDEDQFSWQVEDPPRVKPCTCGGWEHVRDSNGLSFANEADCARFVTEGGEVQHHQDTSAAILSQLPAT